MPVLNLHHPHHPSSGTLWLLWNALFPICSFFPSQFALSIPAAPPLYFLSPLKYSCSPHYSQSYVRFLLYLPLENLLTIKGSTTTSEPLIPRPLFPPLVHLSRHGHTLPTWLFTSFPNDASLKAQDASKWTLSKLVPFPVSLSKYGITIPFIPSCPSPSISHQSSNGMPLISTILSSSPDIHAHLPLSEFGSLTLFWTVKMAS